MEGARIAWKDRSSPRTTIGSGLQDAHLPALNAIEKCAVLSVRHSPMAGMRIPIEGVDPTHRSQSFVWVKQGPGKHIYPMAWLEKVRSRQRHKYAHGDSVRRNLQLRIA